VSIGRGAWLVRRYWARGRMRKRGEENNREDRRGRSMVGEEIFGRG